MAAMGFERITAALLLAYPTGFEQPVALSFFEQLCSNTGF
jgi:hypothetical protein